MNNFNFLDKLRKLEPIDEEILKKELEKLGYKLCDGKGNTPDIRETKIKQNK